MKRLEVREIIRREFERNLTGRKFREVSLGLCKLYIVAKIQQIAQNRRTWIAVNVLSDAILIQGSGLLGVLAQQLFPGKKLTLGVVRRDIEPFKPQTGCVI